MSTINTHSFSHDPRNLRVLAFDVFGTVVDWFDSVRTEVNRRMDVDAAAFASDWRAGYAPAIAAVTRGDLDWTLIDDLHRMILDDLLSQYGVTMTEPDRYSLNRIWHFLDPWPDSAAGLRALRPAYTLCTLSNGNLGLLTDLVRHSDLAFDCLLSAEIFRKYKPDPETYFGVARTFDVSPSQVMLVAAHHNDLAAARECGLMTAYIERPEEFGPHAIKDVSPKPDNDFHARDLLHLAEQLTHFRR
ncbi:MAG: haloacid dehalogenase type II [Gammaproteobacteria bacterium]|nr:haloacid dehalogenase type II [Gammaproteobacteria bacterium]OUU11545.1 MAG: haloacid dehalogenase, type II [Gammaproteobacteria bacterium TMED34]